MASEGRHYRFTVWLTREERDAVIETARDLRTSHNYVIALAVRHLTQPEHVTAVTRNQERD